MNKIKITPLTSNERMHAVADVLKSYAKLYKAITPSDKHGFFRSPESDRTRAIVDEALKDFLADKDKAVITGEQTQEEE